MEAEILKAVSDNLPAIIAGAIATTVAAVWSREFIQRVFAILLRRLSRKTKNTLDDEISQAAEKAYNIKPEEK